MAVFPPSTTSTVSSPNTWSQVGATSAGCTKSTCLPRLSSSLARASPLAFAKAATAFLRPSREPISSRRPSSSTNKVSRNRLMSASTATSTGRFSPSMESSQSTWMTFCSSGDRQYGCLPHQSVSPKRVPRARTRSAWLCTSALSSTWIREIRAEEDLHRLGYQGGRGLNDRTAPIAPRFQRRSTSVSLGTPVSLGVHHILRHIHVDHARPAAPRVSEGAPHQLRDTGKGGDRLTGLGHSCDHTGLIKVLVGAAAVGVGDARAPAAG